MLTTRSAEIRRLRRLTRSADERHSRGLVVLEGARVLDGALRRRAAVRDVYVDAAQRDRHAEVLAGAGAAGALVHEVESGVLDRVREVVTSPGILSVADLATDALSTVVEGATLLLVAVDVSDPGNAGTLLRSAEAFGASAVVFCGTSVDVRNPKVTRASAGACFGVALVEEDDPMQTLEAVGDAGLRLLAAVGHGGRSPEEFLLHEPVAVVVGSEAHGLAPDVVTAAGDEVSIPMAAPAESLNVGVAGSVLLYEVARTRRALDRGGS